MSFNDRLKYLINKSGLTHKEIEENTGVKNISHYKSGNVKPSYDAIIALADFFGVTTDWLLKGTGPAPENKNVIPVFDIIPANTDTLEHNLTESFIDFPLEFEADFACQINQDNMKLIGINKGDLAFFCKTETPQPGQIIATHKINETGVLTLHFLAQKNSQAILRSANLNHEDIPLTGEDVLDGVLIALLKKGVSSLDDYEKWSDVILLANQNNISPAFVKQFLEQQIKMSKTLPK
ncbi:repressor LexA [Sporomusaceae bacterium BoRhaA]|uniref:LexA family protein n=1 Tax=Pelorhabdus rhamnosifermentans TaxID=2772457 RepID=UPI001C05F022|nr:XRE family transcriptional regulator [Pelorhabdus rhamnosifermentans]MBU2699113.1 repressor LexA [Pelorhabdus rhamnosifermentans]